MYVAIPCLVLSSICLSTCTPLQLRSGAPNINSSTDIPSAITPVPANSSTGPANAVVNTLALSSDANFQFIMLLVAGLAPGHGADTNDVLKTALYIEPGNFESFAEAFADLADHTKATADETLLQSDSHQSFLSQLPASLQRIYNAGDKQRFDDIIGEALHSQKTPSQLRWGVEQGLWAFKFQSLYEFLEATKAYSIANITDRIRMPTFIAEASDDQFFAGQPELVKKALGDRATLHPFNGSAGYHTQVGASVE